ncbi:transcription initiation factor TFIIB [Halogranum gelatinilyticum]|uniref:Transcription initiation factor IIB n=1 Tax=Halogranum gelatinilyticum TaxID=660521 RepID=A0A1G9YJ98_9EURY|nr:transcription initiation factor IIB family protein [Halogranum gelatinilyticum]SDN09147.1 transcription initiation factor TFIIB [Halogranum gelatinilyticum]
MATRDIYETAFDEDVQCESSSNYCPECNGHVATNAVETACEDCGLVIADQQIDHGPEWRSFEDGDNNRERTGAPLTAARHDRGLSTTIGRRTDAKGRTLSGSKRCQLARLRREQTRGRFQSKAERNLAHGLGEIRRITSALGLADSVREQACQLFRSAQREDLLLGRSIEAIAAASVYGVCRCHGRPVARDDFVDVARVDHSGVTNAYKTLNKELGLPTQPVAPQSLIPKLASELGVGKRIRRRARTLAERAHETSITNGYQPSGVAAACLYLAGREHGQSLTQTQVAEAAGTTPTTLRARRAELTELIDGEVQVASP